MSDAGAVDPLREPRLSVVLPVLNESRDLGTLLGQLRAQEVPPGGFEVLVADGGSTDGTRELVAALAGEWPALRLLDNPGRRSSPGRNVGAHAARGEFVMYLDGHCSLERKDYLLRVTRIFEESGADCLCRPQPLTHDPQGDWARAISAARHSRLGHNPGSDIYSDQPGFTQPETAGAAYRREVIAALGGYDERFDACEDVEFNHRVARAGYDSYRHPDLAVHYRPRDTVKGLFQQMFRYGRGRANLMARHPVMTPWILVGLTVLAATALALVIGGGDFGRSTVLVAGGLYALACVLAAWGTTRDPASAGRVALLFPVIHGGLLLGFWRGLPEYLYFRPGFRSRLVDPGEGGRRVSA